MTDFKTKFEENLKRYDWADTGILCENFRLFEPAYWPSIFTQLPANSKTYWLDNCSKSDRYLFVAAHEAFTAKSIHRARAAEKKAKTYKFTTYALMAIVGAQIILTLMQLGAT